MAPKTNINGCGAQGHVQKSRNRRKEGFAGSHISESKSYKFQLKQNNTMELLSISFHTITIKITQEIEKTDKNNFSVFSDFL